MLDDRIETDTYRVLADHELLEGVIQVALTEPLLQHLKVWLAPSLQQLLHQRPGCCITCDRTYRSARAYSQAHSGSSPCTEGARDAKLSLELPII